MTPLQQFVQEKTIMAAHPECETLLDAKRKELIAGCVIAPFGLQEENWLKVFNNEGKFYGGGGFNGEDYDEDEIINANEIDLTENQIIGLPCTLARVLNALSYSQEDHMGFIREFWVYLNKDGTDALFEDQSEECQMSIAKLLGYSY